MKSVPGGFSQPSGVHFPYGSQLWLGGWPDPPQRYLPGSLTIKSWLGLESRPCSPSGQAKCPSCWAPVLVYFSTASLSRVWEPTGLWCAVASSTSSHSNPSTSLHLSCCNRLVSHHQTHPPCNSFLLALVVVGRVYISFIFCIWYKLKRKKMDNENQGFLYLFPQTTLFLSPEASIVNSFLCLLLPGRF